LEFLYAERHYIIERMDISPGTKRFVSLYTRIGSCTGETRTCNHPSFY